MSDQEMARGTPGPWHPWARIGRLDADSTARREADARLYARAPEIYNALLRLAQAATNGADMYPYLAEAERIVGMVDRGMRFWPMRDDQL